MAPEILYEEPATAQSDAWSLGMLLYEMLTGNRPNAGGTLFELSMVIMVGEWNLFLDRSRLECEALSVVAC
jgi:serine/threonine protein kinase